LTGAKHHGTHRAQERQRATRTHFSRKGEQLIELSGRQLRKMNPGTGRECSAGKVSQKQRERFVRPFPKNEHPILSKKRIRKGQQTVFRKMKFGASKTCAAVFSVKIDPRKQPQRLARPHISRN
jgi:hypothetical protein